MIHKLVNEISFSVVSDVVSFVIVSLTEIMKFVVSLSTVFKNICGGVSF